MRGPQKLPVQTATSLRLLYKSPFKSHRERLKRKPWGVHSPASEEVFKSKSVVIVVWMLHFPRARAVSGPLAQHVLRPLAFQAPFQAVEIQT